MKNIHLAKLMALWMVISIIFGGVGPAVGDEPGSGLQLKIRLEAGNYQLFVDDLGQTHIDMDQDFGSFSKPGEPQLPGRTFLIALPPGAVISRVTTESPVEIALGENHWVTPMKLAVADPAEVERASAVWDENYRNAYASDMPYPDLTGEFLGQSQWRGVAVARVAYQPFMYRANSGSLYFYPYLDITLQYHFSDPGDTVWKEIDRLKDDHVLDDIMARTLVNFDQAQAWYSPQGSSVPASSLYDYVIIVQNEAAAAAVAPFKNWKEELGHTVNTVTLEWIADSYSGVDVAEEVWNFLHDKFPSSQWGIRYVLLVGDLRIIPTRRVYYADEGWGLRSDHFFAKIAGGSTSAEVWNRDGDKRWGELHDDELSLEPDVLVGRIPLNDLAQISNAVQAMIRFEQDPGSWKHQALLAGGYNDINSASVKTDNAVPLELINNQLLKPNGWTATRLFEQSGLGTSTYSPPPDGDTSRENVVSYWNADPHGFVLLTDHGGTNGLSGVIWANDDLANPNQVDPGERVWSDLFLKSDAAHLITDTPPIVGLFGCSTLMLVTPPWPIPDETMVEPGGYTTNTGSALLANGAAAGVVGFSSPVPYSKGWSSLTNGNEQTFTYYFVENLVTNRYPLGQALFETKIRYNNNFYKNNYSPFHWAFNLFGDPSMVLEGFDMSAKGTNTTIHNGPVYAFGTDNDDNGDMYVAVSTRPDDVDGQIKVYRSEDHGMTWNLWTTIDHTEGIQAVDVLVSRWYQDEFGSDLLHVFFTDTAGHVIDMNIELANPVIKTKIYVSSEGPGKRLFSLSAARTPTAMPAHFVLHLAWEVGSGSLSQVKTARSAINGLVWVNQYTFEGVHQPSIDAGPNLQVYLSAVESAFPNNVLIKTSPDRGETWGAWTNLTSGDGANYHATPAVAASTNAAVPTVWVAYNYYHQMVFGAIDLRYAYSLDGGVSWTKNVILSAEKNVDELFPDMVGFRSEPNHWMNIAYNRVQSSGTQVVWRWATGSTPSNWWAPRIVNDHATHPALGPQIIYSPGSPAAGSGVVYNGSGSPLTNLYFAAPWLTGFASAANMPIETDASFEAVNPGLKDHSQAELLAPFHGIQNCDPCLSSTSQPGQAFRVSSLAQSSDGVIYAAAVTTEVNEANTGRVFSSRNRGITWESTTDLQGAWWLESLLYVGGETLLASGTRYIPGEEGGRFIGVIYRTENGGESWSPAAQWEGATMINSLIRRANGDLVAGSGPEGVILQSRDSGLHWEALPIPPDASHIYDLVETEGGRLFAGGIQTGEKGVIYLLTGETWMKVNDLPEVDAVHALAASSGFLYAGVSSYDGNGQIFRSSDWGETWELLPPMPASKAVRALLPVPSGLIAGLDVGDGVFTTTIHLYSRAEHQWTEAEMLFMADAVHDLYLSSQGEIYAATGNTYGIVFSTRLGTSMEGSLYLPFVIK
jgi:photosystem II stability/assembly factor-like uncharacterized protein